jgi:cardiolipin synthase
MTNHRVLGPAESRVLLASGLGLTVVAVLATFFPRLLAVPLALLAFWTGAALLWRAGRLSARHRLESAKGAPALLPAVPLDRAVPTVLPATEAPVAADDRTG